MYAMYDMLLELNEELAELVLVGISEHLDVETRWRTLDRLYQDFQLRERLDQFGVELASITDGAYADMTYEMVMRLHDAQSVILGLLKTLKSAPRR